MLEVLLASRGSDSTGKAWWLKRRVLRLLCLGSNLPLSVVTLGDLLMTFVSQLLLCEMDLTAAYNPKVKFAATRQVL